MLGVTHDATLTAIKRAYRRLARRYHPDMNGTNPEWAAERFKEVAAAYEVLSDPHRRARYDRGGRLPVRSRGWTPYRNAPPAWRYVW